MARHTFVIAVIIASILLIAVSISCLKIFSHEAIQQVDHFPNRECLPIYIVSLPSRKSDRLIPLMNRIGGKNDDRYDVRAIVGVDGRQVVEDFSREGFLNKGQIGCWLSHVGIWRMIAKQAEPVALVLEDDAMIQLPDMLKDIDEILSEIPDVWDVCYLGGSYADNSSVIRVSTRLVTSNTSRIWHSHAYLLTKAGAANLLEQSSHFNDSVKQDDFANIIPVDDWMTNPERNLKIFKVDPDLIDFVRDEISDT